jgi:YVTN family beta-propeller protein
LAKWLATIALSLTLPLGAALGGSPASIPATGPQQVHASPQQTWTVGDNPESLVISPDGRTLYVANTDSHSISVIDTSTGNTKQSIDIQNGLFDIAVSPDGSQLFATRHDIGAVTVFKTDSYSVERSISVGANPTFVVASPDGRSLYVSHETSNTLAIVDLATAQVTDNIQLTYPPTNLAVSADGKRLYISSDTTFVTVLDLESKTEIAKIDLGCPPFTIAIDEARKTIYVACGLASKVAVIDAKSNKAAAPIAVRGKPYGFAVDSKAGVGFVTDAFANKISVIDLASKTVIAHLDIGAPSTFVKENPVNGRLYVLLEQNNQVATLGFPRATAVKSQKVKEGGSVTFSSTVINDPASMHWEVSADKGHSFDAIPGATSSSFSFDSTLANNGYLYRLVLVDSFYGDSATTPAKLTVVGKPHSNPLAAGFAIDPLFIAAIAIAVLLLAVIALLVVYFVRRPKTPPE